MMDSATTNLSALFNRLSPLSLADLDTTAGTTRYDRKYLISVDRAEEAVGAFADRFGALEVDGRRTFDYVSVYFDTSDLTTFRMHRQGRRRRFKVRTRHYGDPSGAMLEVKCTSARGQTVKYRRTHPASAPDVLNDEAQAFVVAALHHHYGLDVEVPDLSATVTTAFNRSTLANLATGERITFDRCLRAHSPGGAHDFRPDWAIVETKTSGQSTSSARTLRSLGAREGRLSKYCLGVAVLYPEFHANPWQRSLRVLASRAASDELTPAQTRP